MSHSGKRPLQGAIDAARAALSSILTLAGCNAGVCETGSAGGMGMIGAAALGAAAAYLAGKTLRPQGNPASAPPDDEQLLAERRTGSDRPFRAVVSG